MVKGFDQVKTAQLAYESFANSHIPALLAEQEPTADECFIVVEGAKPMAYRNRKGLIMDGLGFQGGVAYRFLGSFADAREQFQQFKREGMIRRV